MTTCIKIIQVPICGYIILSKLLSICKYANQSVLNSLSALFVCARLIWLKMKLSLLYGLTLYSFILVSRRIVINSYPLCRNGGRSTWGNRQTTVVRLRSLQESGSNEKQQTLFTLPSSPAAREEIVSLVQGWALSEAEEGPAVQVEVTDNGVIFGFKASQKSYLALDVISSDDNSVLINSLSVV